MFKSVIKVGVLLVLCCSVKPVAYGVLKLEEIPPIRFVVLDKFFAGDNVSDETKGNVKRFLEQMVRFDKEFLQDKDVPKNWKYPVELYFTSAPNVTSPQFDALLQLFKDRMGKLRVRFDTFETKGGKLEFVTYKIDLLKLPNVTRGKLLKPLQEYASSPKSFVVADYFFKKDFSLSEAGISAVKDFLRKVVDEDKALQQYEGVPKNWEFPVELDFSSAPNITGPQLEVLLKLFKDRMGKLCVRFSAKNGYGNPVTYKNINSLLAFIPEKLQELDLSYCKELTDEGLKNFDKPWNWLNIFLGRRQKQFTLASINLTGCSNVTAKGIACLKKLPLKKLSLGEINQLNDKGSLFLQTIREGLIGTWRNIIELDLHGNNLSNEEVSCDLVAFQDKDKLNLARLKKLNLSNNNLESGAVNQLFGADYGVSGMENLDLSNNCLNEFGAVVFRTYSSEGKYEKSRVLPNLEKLNLAGNNIKNPEVIRQLKEVYGAGLTIEPQR